MKKLKLAFFNFGFFYEGGGERLLLEQMKGLEKKGHQTVCFTPVLKKKCCYPDWIEKFKIKTLAPQWFNWSSDGMVVQMLISGWLAIFQFWRFIKYDCFIGVGQPGAWIAFCLSGILNKPYLVWMNQPTRFLYPRLIDRKNGLRIDHKIGLLSRLLYLFKPIIFYLDMISVRKADLIMANSITICRWLERVYKKGVILNYPGGSYGKNSEKKRLKSYSQRSAGSLRIKNRFIKKPFILVTNRHFPQKKFEFAIGLMPFLNNRFPELKLVITGRKNQYTKRLEAMVSQLGLQEKVIFTDWVNEVDLKKLYSRALVYLYVGPEEDYGMGIIEAMSLGAPVVAWNEAGPKETIVNNKTGFLIKPYDLEKMKQKTGRIISDRNLFSRLSRQAAIRAGEFSYQNHIDKLEKYLFILVKKNEA